MQATQATMASQELERSAFSVALEKTMDKFPSLVASDIVTVSRSRFYSRINNGQISNLKLGRRTAQDVTWEAILLSIYNLDKNAYRFFFKVLDENLKTKGSGKRSTSRRQRNEETICSIVSREMKVRGLDPMIESDQRQLMIQAAEEIGAAIPLKILQSTLRGEPIETVWLEQLAQICRKRDGKTLYSSDELIRIRDRSAHNLYGAADMDNDENYTLKNLIEDAFKFRGLDPSNLDDHPRFVQVIDQEIGIDLDLNALRDALLGRWIDDIAVGDIAQVVKKRDLSRFSVRELIKIRNATSHRDCTNGAGHAS